MTQNPNSLENTLIPLVDVGTQATLGNARFTVIADNCIRMEYVTRQCFVDEPTLFASNRSTRCTDAKVVKDGNGLIIDTGKLRLEYHPDGSAFSAANLKVLFKSGEKNIEWNPETKNTHNLGGPVATLDDWNGPRELPDGLLSRDGWYMLDDSGQPILKDDWITQRPGGISPNAKRERGMVANSDIDWYLFAYGSDYKGALHVVCSIRPSSDATATCSGLVVLPLVRLYSQPVSADRSGIQGP